MKQSEALDILKMGHNVFLTGFAGSGKTFLLNKYIEYLKGNNVEVGVTASTGIAATHMEGRTIHSWAGMGINDKMTKTEIKKILKKPHLRKRIANARVLIIDEISMLGHRQLDLADQICRIGKEQDLPFGGMQVILSGDFFQLPPINRASNEEQNKFATESAVWQEMELKICYLDEQFRQSDQLFTKILNEIRDDRVTADTISTLMTRLNIEVAPDVIPTKLNTHNADVDSINERELAKIQSKEVLFEMNATGSPEIVKILKKGCLAPEEIILKQGAVVMFVKNNFNKGYVNGTLGTVVGFDPEKGWPVVEIRSGKRILAEPESWGIEEEGKVIAEVDQVPLRLAWAISVHKSQGMSLETAEIDLSRAFERGMGYVALSRVRTLDGIKLTGLNNMALSVNKDVVGLNREFIIRSQMDSDQLKGFGKKRVHKMQKDFINEARG
ncbi:MAG: PIF1 family DEAD/DEAH box helicase [Patescibacteria group bacterium]|jgi:ATP-dependent exoDNAse (exonuclease V) alpha subunit